MSFSRISFTCTRANNGYIPVTKLLGMPWSSSVQITWANISIRFRNLEDYFYSRWTLIPLLIYRQKALHHAAYASGADAVKMATEDRFDIPECYKSGLSWLRIEKWPAGVMMRWLSQSYHISYSKYRLLDTDLHRERLQRYIRRHTALIIRTTLIGRPNVQYQYMDADQRLHISR